MMAASKANGHSVMSEFLKAIGVLIVLLAVAWQILTFGYAVANKVLGWYVTALIGAVSGANRPPAGRRLKCPPRRRLSRFNVMNRKHKHAFRHSVLPQSETAQLATPGICWAETFSQHSRS
jgi:hypothetical protein